jgi:hypothetical protein
LHFGNGVSWSVFGIWNVFHRPIQIELDTSFQAIDTGPPVLTLCQNLGTLLIFEKMNLKKASSGYALARRITSCPLLFHDSRPSTWLQAYLARATYSFNTRLQWSCWASQAILRLSNISHVEARYPWNLGAQGSNPYATYTATTTQLSPSKNNPPISEAVYNT